jgi:archaellum biogenesis protein FlaJ (TadC family)
MTKYGTYLGKPLEEYTQEELFDIIVNIQEYYKQSIKNLNQIIDLYD